MDGDLVDTKENAWLGAGIVLLFTTGLQESLLGALLTFAPRPLYDLYEAGGGLWALTPLEDQQLAGIIMWIPGGLTYLIAAVVLTQYLLFGGRPTGSAKQLSSLQSAPPEVW